MKISELRLAAGEWQARLGLHEWELLIAWGKKAQPGCLPEIKKLEMDDDCEGNCYWQPEHPFGIILLRRKSTAHLHTLVHEMLHLRLEGHQNQPNDYDPLYERSINALTAALLGETEPNAVEEQC